MADQSGSPTLITPIPSQIVNEGAAFGPLDLNDFIESAGPGLRFQAELENGKPLTAGLICTSYGIISGIPAVGTVGNHEIVVKAENDSGIPLITKFSLTIKQRIAMESTELIGNFKPKVWEALMKNLPIPEMADVFNQPLTAVELYYLLQRFAVLTIWDVYNLEMPHGKEILKLEGISKHYNVYDRGSCIVGAPKELFSHQRTLADALQTSQAMAREVYKRGWTIELAGFNKMIRGAWIELQHLGDKHGKHLDVLHFQPSVDDLRVYAEQARAIAASSMGI